MATDMGRQGHITRQNSLLKEASHYGRSLSSSTVVTEQHHFNSASVSRMRRVGRAVRAHYYSLVREPGLRD